MTSIVAERYPLPLLKKENDTYIAGSIEKTEPRSAALDDDGDAAAAAKATISAAAATIELPEYLFPSDNSSDNKSNTNYIAATADTQHAHGPIKDESDGSNYTDKYTDIVDETDRKSSDEKSQSPQPPSPLPPTLPAAFYPHQSQHNFGTMSSFSQHYSLDADASTGGIDTRQDDLSGGHHDTSGGDNAFSPLQSHPSTHQSQHSYYSSSVNLLPHMSQQHGQHQSPYFGSGGTSSGNNLSSLLPTLQQPPQQQQQQQTHDTQSGQSFLMQRPSTAMPLTNANSSALYTSARGLGLGSDSSLHDTLFSTVTQPRASMRAATSAGRASNDTSTGGRYMGGSGNTPGTMGNTGDDAESDELLSRKSVPRRSSEDELAQCQYTVTTEICLRARNGDRSADVWYPRAPNVMAIMSQLGEPYTNGTTALHFFAAAQHEREREQQQSAHAFPHRPHYNAYQLQPQPQSTMQTQPQQPAQPFYHTVPGTLGDNDHVASGTTHSYGGSLGMGGGGGSALAARSTHASGHVSQLPGALCYHPPPLEDFSHPNPHLRPRTQEERLRYPSDLYTPRWIRDEGAKREGWCSLCEQGQWLQLKTSQYWYHVKGAHGVNYHTGQIYDPPVQLRIFHDTCGTTHGLCGQCGDWVKIVTPRRKRNFASWFRHAQKCQRSQLPAGLFGFAPASSLSGSVPGTAAGLPGSDGGSRGIGTSSGTSGTFQHSMTGSSTMPPTSSHGTATRDADTSNEGANIFAEPRSSSTARSTRSWAMSTAGTVPSTATTAKSQSNHEDGTSASPGAGALSLPPSPRSSSANASSRLLSLQQQMYRHMRTQPSSSRESSGQHPPATSAGYATPQTYDDLTAITRGIRSAPHHISTFQLGDTSTSSHGYSNAAEGTTSGDMSGSLGSGHHTSNSMSSVNNASTPTGMPANQFIATSAGAAASAAVAAQSSSTYSALAGASQHTFPALTPQSSQRSSAPVSAAWLT